MCASGGGWQQGDLYSESTSNSFWLKFRVISKEVIRGRGWMCLDHIVVTHGKFLSKTLTLELPLMKMDLPMIHKAVSIQRLGNGNN